MSTHRPDRRSQPAISAGPVELADGMLDTVNGGKEPEDTEKLLNFEIQDLMSQYNQAETPARPASIVAQRNR